MHVSDLIELLRKAPPDAVVSIGGDVIHGIEVRPGHIEIGYFNPVFRFDPYGKSKAVVFLCNVEMTNGEIVSMPK